jgi:hypothetical protein
MVTYLLDGNSTRRSTMTTYKIIRFYHPNIDKPNRVIQRGLTLQEAQQWCRDPETRKDGEWFDGYDQD